jgi:hypothetical protein
VLKPILFTYRHTHCAKQRHFFKARSVKKSIFLIVKVLHFMIFTPFTNNESLLTFPGLLAAGGANHPCDVTGSESASVIGIARTMPDVRQTFPG